VPAILAIDTSTGPCSVAIFKDGALAQLLESNHSTTQSVSLLPMIEAVLAKTALSYEQLGLIACTVGPGSFTGIRVGLGAARGICFSANKPGFGATTLEVLAFGAYVHAAEKPPHVLAVLNAGKGEVYYQLFTTAPWLARFEVRLGAPEAALAQAPADALLAGNMDFGDVPASHLTFPRADALALLAAQAVPDSALALQPFYLREPDAKLPVAK